MLFNSYEFIFLFLPLAYFGYVAVGRLGGRRASIAWLAAASLVFYALGEASSLALICGSIAFNYLVGLGLSHSDDPARRRMLLIVGLAGNLGALAYFKYTNFVVGNLLAPLGADPGIGHVILPIGISFFTFTQIAYVVDAYRRQAQDYSPISYALFVTFFPHLIAGPIIHHKEMMPQFGGLRPKDRASDAAVGLSIFIIGLAKKVLVADSVASLSTRMFDAAGVGVGPTVLDAWIGALAYTFQIYFDFSGYSDMAIGLSRMFGIRLPINFDSPYKAVSIADFWRRWHITLSRFLRDYLYFPLGGSRKGTRRRYVNLIITMLLGGIWHGAGWTFVVWGLMHGVFLAVNHAWRDLRGRLGLPALPRWPARILTFLCVVVAWVPFRAPDLGAALAVWRGMIGLNGFAMPMRPTWVVALFGPGEGIVSSVSQSLKFLPILLIAVWVLPNTQQLMRSWGSGLVSPGYYPVAELPHWLAWLGWRPSVIHALGLAVLGVITVLYLSKNSEFIYFQF